MAPLLALLMMQDPTRAAEPKIGEHGGASYRLWLADLDGTARSDRPAIPGTDVEFDGDLNVSGSDLLHELRGWVQLGPYGNVRASWWSGRFEGSETLDTAITFGGSTYAAGTPVESDISFRVASLLYEYPFVATEQFELGGQVGLRFIGAEARIESPSVNEKGDLQALLPVVGARATYAPSPWMRGELELSGLIFGAGGRHVRLLDVTVEVLFTAEWFVGGVGFRYVQVFTKQEDGQDTEETDATLAGPYLTLGVRF